jgi:hypothetical protein
LEKISTAQLAIVDTFLRNDLFMVIAMDAGEKFGLQTRKLPPKRH